MHLPVSTLDRLETVSDVGREAHFGWSVSVCEEEICLVYTVYGPVVWHPRAGQLSERREGIRVMDDLITHDTRRNLPGREATDR